MKLNYFSQPEPDLDDRALFDARSAGIVPKGCLLGGVMIESLTAITTNPCDACYGPRDRCGGTPMLTAEERAYAEKRSQIAEIFGIMREGEDG